MKVDREMSAMTETLMQWKQDEVPSRAARGNVLIASSSGRKVQRYQSTTNR
ncbi:MAG: hypothetical protein JEZ06_21100 [Anaerolineaceae bacterium]|nr:hypothetical protein [Anaerolineaceae bacterium]